MGKRGSIQSRLVLLTLAALIPAFLVIVFNEYRLVSARRAEVRDNALRSAKLASADLERFSESIKSLFIAIALVPELAEGREEQCSRYLSTLLPNIAFLRHLQVIRIDGTVICSSGQARNASAFDTSLSQRTIASGDDITLGEYSGGATYQAATLPVAMPVRIEGLQRAVIAADIDLGWLGEQLRNRVPPDGSLTLADRNGVILARYPQPERFVGTKIPDTFMKLVDAPAPGVIELVSQDGTPRIVGFMPVSMPPRGLYVSAGLSEWSSFAAVNRSNRISAIIAAGGAVIALLSSWIAGKMIFLKPLGAITSTMDRWRSGDEKARTGFESERSEIAALGFRLDQMMDEFVEQKDRNAVLSQELAHRVKNTLAIIQAIARFTFSNPDRNKASLEEFTSRIQAMGGAHDLLMRANWSSALLRTVVAKALEPQLGDLGRIELEGPDVMLGPKQALAMTMVLHELCTNAMKYGALSTPGGRVGIGWGEVSVSAGPAMRLIWTERGGPPVTPPANTGFGSTLIKRGFGNEFDAVTLAYPPDGVTCEIYWTIG